VSDRNQVGFEEAVSLLIRLVEEQEYQNEASRTQGDGELRKSYFVKYFLLNQVVDCWRTCWRDGIIDTKPTEMLEIIDQLERRGLVPDSRTLTLVIDGITLRGDRHEAPLLAQWLLDRRMEQADLNPDMRPDTVMITNVIRAWSKSKRLEAPEMAEGLLQLMHDLYENGWVDSGPNTLSYGVAMEAWYNSNDPEASEKVEKLLDDMKNCSVEAVRPDRVSYMYVINTWANSHSSIGPHRANTLLQEMIQLYENGNDDVTPDVSIFSRVMLAFARRGNANKAEQVFEQLQELYSSTVDPRFKPNDDCWKALIIAFAKTGSPAQAQGILDELIEKAKIDQNRTMPKRSYFVDILVAWTKDRNRFRASEQSQKVLIQLLDLSKAGHSNLIPDAKCFEKVMQSWSKTNSKHATKNIESLLSLMDQVFQETGNKVVKPNGRTIELAMLAWSRSNQPEAPGRVEALFEAMERRHYSGESSMRPSRGAYTTLMSVWQRSRLDNSRERIEEIFYSLEKKYREGENHLRPDLYIYSILMDCHAQHGDATKTQETFDKMMDDYSNGNKEAKPDILSYNKLLKSFAFSNDPLKAQRAQSLFKSMEDFGRDQNIELIPNHQTFNEMIAVWSFSNESNAAEMCQHYLYESRLNNFESSIAPYTIVIDAWNKSKDSNARYRAEEVLNILLKDTKAGKVRTPFHKLYRKFLQTVGRSKIPGRNRQAKKLLRSLNPGSEIPRFLLPPFNNESKAN
jgi:tetratricopeptide (TPR) repeat protein